MTITDPTYQLRDWLQINPRTWRRRDGAQAISPEAPPEYQDTAKYPNAGKGWHADAEDGNRIRSVYRTAESAMKAVDKMWPLETP